ncbi:ABC transporter, ATP-binding protein [Bordetella bronchiseptica OSU553]|nr:ABC transporter, ATP-binding protein [Bordetella bronchiseptica OSU553]
MTSTGTFRLPAGPALAALLVLAFLALFLVFPVGTVFYTAFVNADGSFTLGHFGAFFNQPLMKEAFFNSLYVAGWSSLLASLIAVPLAYFTVRFEFRGALLIQTLGVLPLIMPPFVGAVAMQLIFGRSGSVNLLLDDWLGITLPFMDGLNGVIFVESLHYFPFILMNLVVALRNIDGSMEEAAFNLGSRGFRLFCRIIFPLALPGYLAGTSLVFVKVFDDLGTPLVLGTTNMLAPQAYLRITQVGLEDPLGYVISVIMIGFSILALWLSARVLKGKDYSTLQKGGNAIHKRRLRPVESVLAYAWIGAVLLLVLSPHLGVLLLSLASVWSYAPLPDGYTLAHYTAVFTESQGMIANTLLYCGLAAGVDVVLGTAIAYLMLRTRLPARQWLDFIASAALAIPGIVLAIGYLRTFPGRGNPRHRRAVDLVLGADHDRLFGAAPALCAALVRGGPAADQRVARRGGRVARRQPAAHHPPHRRAADGRRHAGRLRHQLHHRRGRAVGHHHAGHARQPGAHELRHLPVHAKRGRARPGRGAGRAGRGRGRHRHLRVSLAGRARLGAPAAGAQRGILMKKVSVECRNIRLSYGRNEVLKDISIHIEPGEFFALLGPSGSGKSTLLRLIAGFNRQSHGQLLVDGRDIGATPPWDRNIGMVFQNYALWPHMTVWDNVAFGLVERRLPRAEIRDKVAAALELVGLADFGRRRPNQLSGGQQQRVALARTIVIEPQVLLLDEPLSNLDKKLRVQMRQDLLSLQRRLGITTIFVTHDQEEAMTTADRMAVLDHGVVQQIGAPSTLFDYPVNRFVANFVGTMNVLEGEVRERSRGGVVLAVDGVGELHLPVNGDAPQAGRLAASFRPHTVLIEMADGTGDARYVWLPGVVESSEFLGEFTRYQVQVGEQRLTADQHHLAGLSPFPVGAPVAVGLEPTQIRLLAA